MSIDVRPEVNQFARKMEQVLRSHDHKGGWEDCEPLWLLAKLSEEVGELNALLVKLYRSDGKLNNKLAPHQQIDLRTKAGIEAVDIANLAMMIRSRIDVTKEFPSEVMDATD